MSTDHTGSSHLDDGALLRWIDGEADAEERGRWRVHLDACPRCAAEADTLARSAGRVSAELARIGVPPGFAYPDDSARRSVQRQRAIGSGDVWRRAAAVALLLLAPVVLVEPLRAGLSGWIADRWQALESLWAGPAAAPDAGPGAAPESQPATPLAAPERSTLWFRTTAGEFGVQIVSPQAGGTLTIRRTSGESGYFATPVGRSGEHPLVEERLIRIRNAAGSSASYEIGLPPSVERVVVRVGDAVHRIDLGAAPAVTIDLAAPALDRR